MDLVLMMSLVFVCFLFGGFAIGYISADIFSYFFIKSMREKTHIYKFLNKSSVQ